MIRPVFACVFALVIFSAPLRAAQSVAEQTQRAFDAQKSLQTYTSNYIAGIQASSYNTPSRSVYGSSAGDDEYKRVLASTAAIFQKRPTSAPSSTEAKMKSANADRSKPAIRRANLGALKKFYEGHGFSAADATSYAELEVELSEGFRAVRRSGANGGSGNSSDASSVRTLTADDQAFLANQERKIGAQNRVRNAARENNAEWERKAAGGDTKAMRDLAENQVGISSHARLAWLEKAAALGDLEAMTAAYEWRVQATGFYDETKVRDWANKLAATGYAPAALRLAESLTTRNAADVPVAIETLERAFKIKADFRVGALLVTLCKNGGPGFPPDLPKAFDWAQRTLATPSERRARIAVVRSIPVEAPYAQKILTLLQELANDSNDGWDAGYAALDLAMIYRGKSAAWQPFITPDPAKEFEWSVRAARIKPSLYPQIARGYLKAGETAKAEQLFAEAGNTREGHAVLAAAEFWSERNDGKADGEKAVALFRRCTKGGDLYSYVGVIQKIGDVYRYGKGVPKNMAKAIEWYEFGVKDEDVGSVRALAQCLFRGDGVARDQARAFQLLEKAAAFNTTGSGPDEAKFDTIMLRMEQAASQQKPFGPEQARALWKENEPKLRALAAGSSGDGKWGEPRAQSLLGALLVRGELGDGGAKAVSEGWTWIERAQKAGEPRAQTQWSGRLLGSGGKDRPLGGLNDADREQAFDLLTQAAEAGWAEAGLALGTCFRRGWHVAPDEKKALEWLEWTAAKDSRLGLRDRIDLLVNGQAARDVPRGIALLQPLARAGEAWAQNMLGVLLWRGDGIPQNTLVALEWLDKAATGGEWLSARSAAKIRMIGGPGLAAEGATALLALEKYSEERGPRAMLQLGLLYAGDAAVNPWFPPDLVKAEKWFLRVLGPPLTAEFGVDHPDRREAETQIRKIQDNAAAARQN